MGRKPKSQSDSDQVLCCRSWSFREMPGFLLDRGKLWTRWELVVYVGRKGLSAPSPWATQASPGEMVLVSPGAMALPCQVSLPSCPMGRLGTGQQGNQDQVLLV